MIISSIVEAGAAARQGLMKPTDAIVGLRHASLLGEGRGSERGGFLDDEDWALFEEWGEEGLYGYARACISFSCAPTLTY